MDIWIALYAMGWVDIAVHAKILKRLTRWHIIYGLLVGWVDLTACAVGWVMAMMAFGVCNGWRRILKFLGGIVYTEY